MEKIIIIAINSGIGLRVIGGNGHYDEEIANAKIFADEIEAHEYIERHGLEKLASVRCIGIGNNLLQN